MKFIVEGIKYPIIIQRKNNKNTYIRVNSHLEIVVSTSLFTTSKAISKLLEENRESVKRMLNRQKKEAFKTMNFYYLGKKYDIIMMPTLDKVEIDQSSIYASSTKELRKWYQKKMKLLYEERLDYLYHRFTEKIPYPKLKIRTMKTRWGVCNKRDTSITLNANLMKEPLECLDYVIVHELAHLVHFDHSKEFWNTVSIYFPQYKKIRKQLKE